MKFIYSRNEKLNGLIKLSTAFLFVLMTTMLIKAAAPTNDGFLNAQLLSGVNGTFVGTNVDATKQVGEPYHSGNLGGSSIWYKFVAPGNGVLHFATSNTNFDTVVGVYTGTTVGGLTLVGKNDNDELDGWAKIYSRVYIGTQAGQTYYIAVDGKNAMNGNGALEGQVAGTFSFENEVLNDDFNSAMTLATGTGTYMISTTNVGASKESGEPNHMGNSGGKSVWFNFSNPTSSPRKITLTLDSSKAGVESHQVRTLLQIYSGNTLSTLTPLLNGPQPYHHKIQVTFLAAPSSTYHIAIDGSDDGPGADTGSFTLTYGIAKDNRISDFDQDGRADLTVYRPTDGTFFSRDSGSARMRAYRWGMNGDIPLLSKGVSGSSYYMVFRPNNGAWYITTSTLDSYFSFHFGQNGDVPLAFLRRHSSGVIDNISIVFHGADGTWWSPYNGGSVTQFGQPGDIPLTADFNGDSIDEYVVFRPSNGHWYFMDVTTGQTSDIHFGQSGDIPVPADYTGDGIADIAIFRQSTGVWWFLNAQTGNHTPAPFGQFGDQPQPADYDGDGKADICIVRNGVWWILQSSSGVAKAITWGNFNDLPVAAPVPAN